MGSAVRGRFHLDRGHDSTTAESQCVGATCGRRSVVGWPGGRTALQEAESYGRHRAVYFGEAFRGEEVDVVTELPTSHELGTCGHSTREQPECAESQEYPGSDCQSQNDADAEWKKRCGDHQPRPAGGAFRTRKPAHGRRPRGRTVCGGRGAATRLCRANPKGRVSHVEFVADFEELRVCRRTGPWIPMRPPRIDQGNRGVVDDDVRMMPRQGRISRMQVTIAAADRVGTAGEFYPPPTIGTTDCYQPHLHRCRNPCRWPSKGCERQHAPRWQCPHLLQRQSAAGPQVLIPQIAERPRQFGSGESCRSLDFKVGRGWGLIRPIGTW